MKKLLSILCIIPFLSCSTMEEEIVDLDIFGDWILVQTSGQVPNSQQTGADMPFQETYTLNRDRSFTKIRIDDGVQLTATGVFELAETNNGENKFIYFHHDSKSILLATCFNALTEYLYFTPAGKLISTHNQCDGLGLEYEKQNKV